MPHLVKTKPSTLYCNFCGKNRDEVFMLVSGVCNGLNAAMICDECVALAQKIINEKKIEKAAKAGDSSPMN